MESLPEDSLPEDKKFWIVLNGGVTPGGIFFEGQEEEIIFVVNPSNEERDLVDGDIGIREKDGAIEFVTWSKKNGWMKI